jgi:hypothetical protein
MRVADSRRRFPAVVAVVVATAVGMLASIVMLVVGPVPAARAAVGALTVGVDSSLSLVDEAVRLTIRGDVSGQPAGAELLIRVNGPATLSQVAQSDPVLPEAAVISQTPGTDVILPAGTPAAPGAYLVTVELKSGGVVQASGREWLGKAARRDMPLDIAFVWTAALGIHHDPSGVFFDQVLEQAAAPAGEGSGSLRALFGLGDRFPRWQFTLAVEPVLLAQLRDMADGYARLDASGGRVDVGNEDPSAADAEQTLAAFRDLAATDSVEIAVSPYAGPALGVLAAEGWRDGFEQIQLGKQEIEQTLKSPAALIGGYSPDLDLTTDGLAYYALAFIDHVVVDDRVATDLSEPVGNGAVAVRAQNAENDRVTLILASGGLRALVTPPWDVGVLFAGLAAELASAPREAVVITPGMEFVVPPSSYLDAIGEALGHVSWVRTQTLTALLKSHSPGTRPVLLNRDVSEAPGYIEGSLLASLRAAHAVVSDLAVAGGVARAPVEAARHSLYLGESRWWSRAQTSPQEASVGLAYAEQARALAQAELDRVRFLGAGSTLFTGRTGVVTLAVENGANYPLTVEVQLAGGGLTLPGGDYLRVELPSGRTEIPVRVGGESGAHSLDARLVIGDRTLDEWSHSVRFITITTVVALAVAGVVALGGTAYAAMRLRRRKHRARA